MSIDGPIRDVVVAGGGLAGWSTAAALKRRIPSLNVAIISSVPRNSLVDRVISTLPSIGVFHEDLGLTEADTIWGARSGFRVGTRFEGWARGLPEYVHAYGDYGAISNGVSFHQLWLRCGEGTTFDRFSAAAELGRQGRLPVSDASSKPGAPTVGYGLRLTLERYHELMRAFALHLGVTERRSEIVEVRIRSEDGFVEELALSDRSRIAGDLFVDCTGPEAVIRARMDSNFRDWSDWLPCDRVIFATSPADQEPQLLDRVSASAAGWSWSASSPSVRSFGAAYSSAHMSDDAAVDAIPPPARSTADEILIKQGRWEQPWVRNCVAIGEAAVALEPLEWTNLHLAHSQVDRLISMMPGRDCAPVELAEYNRQCNAEADRVRDFICMHYVTARRDEPFWKDVAAIEPPESLAHTLSLFAERGRLPLYEEETFTRDSWLAVLFGQGFLPRRTDPLADVVTSDEAKRALAACQDSVDGFVSAQPSYGEFMSRIGQRA